MVFKKIVLNEAANNKFNIEFDDVDYLKSTLDSYNLNISPDEFCYQLTAYERGGSVDYDKGVVSIIADYADDEPDLSDYLDYLMEERQDDYWTEFTDESFNELCSGLEAFDIACKVQYGNFNPNDDYIRLDGYANFETASQYEVTKEMNEDNDFLMYWCENKFSDLFNDDTFKEDILNGTNQLLDNGY